MGSSPAIVEQEEHQAVEAPGQVVPIKGALVSNNGPDDHDRIIDILVPMSDDVPKVRTILTHDGHEIRLGKICHFQPGTGKFVLYPHRSRKRVNLHINDISGLQL